MRANIHFASSVPQTSRVLQVASLFDVPMEKKLEVNINAVLPIEDRQWQIGLVVGPSGSGKSSIVRELWPEAIMQSQVWSDNAIVDDFPNDLGVKEVVNFLTSVGLGSTPTWLRPYYTLSNGEQFRASMARLMAEINGALTAVDEFTSVVDRQVAKITAHTVQKAIRRRSQQFIAVSCHYDVIDWLQPDWIYDTATMSFSWRLVQPHPQLEFHIHKISRSYWPMFSRHHYLSSEIASASQCFGGFINDQLVAFACYLHFPHPSTNLLKLAHRVVVLPDYQGLGLGGRINDFVGQYLYENGRYRYRTVTAHPIFIGYLSKSPRWKLVTNNNKIANSSCRKNVVKKNIALRNRHTAVRAMSTKSFEYMPIKNRK